MERPALRCRFMEMGDLAIGDSSATAAAAVVSRSVPANTGARLIRSLSRQPSHASAKLMR